MFNRNLLKAEIVKNGLTQEEFCKIIAMPQSTFVRKMKTGQFYTEEAQKICETLHIEDPAKIFFTVF